MAVACLIKNNMNATTGHVQNQLTRSLERIFEDALSGELKLSGRKLKDFPKTAGKYNLSDTVIAGNNLFYINFILPLFVYVKKKFCRRNCHLCVPSSFKPLSPKSQSSK